MHITLKKTTSFTLAVAILFTLVFSFAFTASAQSLCTQLSYTMTLGSSDTTTAGDVSRLQQFLKNKGYFSGAITGYYGTVTQQAVTAWQNKENFYEATGSGTIGPRSRAEILESCSAASITEKSVKSRSNKFKLSGTAEGSKSVFVAIVHPYTNEATDWHTTYISGSYIATTGDTITKVKNGKWRVEFSGIRSGEYEVRVYNNDDSSQRLLATQPLTVSASDEVTFRAGSKKTITLGVGQTATDGGVDITLNDVFLTNGTSGMSRANFVIQSDGFKAGSYSGGAGDYVPEGGGGIVDDEAPNGSMRLKIKSIFQAMNTVMFIVEGGKPKR